MNEYYFKIKKGDIEFECSTTDKTMFEEKLIVWINKINQQETSFSNKEIKEESNQETQIQRSDFIDIQNSSTINEIQTPDYTLFTENNNKDIEANTNLSFEDALNESLKNPKTEVIEKQEPKSDFEIYLNSYNPESPMDYLMITASYVQNIENQERFSIKQLNAKIVPLTNKPIDHAMIKDAMEQDYIRIIPDLTGTSEVTEYSLTEQGETYFIE